MLKSSFMFILASVLLLASCSQSVDTAATQPAPRQNNMQLYSTECITEAEVVQAQQE